MDTTGSFAGVPLDGHLSSLLRGDQRYYWRVARLISESQGLKIQAVKVDDLMRSLGNSSWYGTNEKATVRSILEHVRRALSTDLACPIILSSDGKVMDGSHRIVAAALKGIEELPAIRFSEDPSPDHVEAIK